MIAGVTGGRRPTAAASSADSDLDSLVGALHSSIANVRLTTSQTPVHPLDPVDSYEAVATLLPAHKDALLQNLYSANRSEHLRAVNVLRKYCSLSGKIEEHVKNIMPLNILPRIVELFKVPDGILQYETSWILTNICANVPEAGADVVKAGAVPVLMDQLRSPSWRIAWQAIWTLGNILCTQDTHQAVVHGYPDIIPRLLTVVDFTHYDIPEGEVKEAKQCLNEQCVRALANVAMFPGLPTPNLYDALPFLAENVSPGTEQKALSHSIRGLKLIIGLIGGVIDIRACTPDLLANLASTLRHSLSSGPSYNAMGTLDILSHIASGGPEHIQVVLEAAAPQDGGWAFVLRVISSPRDWRGHISDSVKGSIVSFVVRMTSGSKDQTVTFLRSGSPDGSPWQIWQHLVTAAGRDVDDGSGKKDAVTALYNLISLEELVLDSELLRLEVMKILLEYFKLTVPAHLAAELSPYQPPIADPTLFSRTSDSILSLLNAGSAEAVDPEVAAQHTYGGPNRFAEQLYVNGGFETLWVVWARSQNVGSFGPEYERGVAVIQTVLANFYGAMFQQRVTQLKQMEEMTRGVGSMGI
ncbi:ARM repeat-containing protein [Gonapodya prolifera JEL478]|uniref:ARM repeat-containing protein n=1 Tax=Gonapodya prolifera (strain JEL478) TaxID=1344416 RepID=A0A139AA20_GONPJ|nr:ARM repeat-containing protein [Gonapodya prolifera JEL478]|eukprot:KXS13577.1 ARM repeat-containing protein [Gonapodya prolifera JEL478]